MPYQKKSKDRIIYELAEASMNRIKQDIYINSDNKKEFDLLVSLGFAKNDPYRLDWEVLQALKEAKDE